MVKEVICNTIAATIDCKLRVLTSSYMAERMCLKFSGYHIAPNFHSSNFYNYMIIMKITFTKISSEWHYISLPLNRWVCSIVSCSQNAFYSFTFPNIKKNIKEIVVWLCEIICSSTFSWVLCSAIMATPFTFAACHI